MSNALKMVGYAEEQLRWAERNHHWDYLEKLLELLRVMGAQVLRLDGGYAVQFDLGEPEPEPDYPPHISWRP